MLKSCPLNQNFSMPRKIQFAYLDHMVYPQVLGAVSLAVDMINKDSSILPHTKLDFKFGGLIANGMINFQSLI